MLSRRLFLLLALASCTFAPPAPASAPAPSGLEYLEIVKGEPAPTLPLVVAIHGLGDRPEDFRRLVDGYPGAARFILPYGPAPHRGGFSWFPFDPDAAGSARHAAEVAAAADRLALLLAELEARHPGAGKPLVTGFSQGGILSFALAVRHPERLRLAIPIGGRLPPPLWPEAKPPAAPPIRALHGEADTLIPLPPTRELVARLSALGFDAELTSYPGVGHRIPAEMRAALYDLLGAAQD